MITPVQNQTVSFSHFTLFVSLSFKKGIVRN